MPTTPNMGLLLPIPTITPGPTYASENNDAFDVVDGHDHTLGKGVPVPSLGININNDLIFNAFNATNLRSSQYFNNPFPLSLPSDITCIYVSGGNLYYNNQIGQQVQITSGASLNASSIGGIGGDYVGSGALEFYTSADKTFTFWSSTNVPADLDAGSLTYRNLTLGSNGVKVSPPASIPGNYQLFLPPDNSTGTPSFLTYDTSNNINVGPATSHGITRSNLAAYTGQQISASCGNFINNNPELPPFTPVLNLSVTITTSGGPVWIGIQPDGTGLGNDAFLELFRVSGSASVIIGHIEIRNGTTPICDKEYVNTTANLGGTFYDLGFMCLDTSNLIPGTYTYTVYMYVDAASTAFQWNNYVLVAYEL